jgi:hypothetical protein
MRRFAEARRAPKAVLCLLVGAVAYVHPLNGRTVEHPQPPASAAANEFCDSHFHLTNYVQQGIEVRSFLQIMGTRVGRSTLFGIPLQQQWSYANSGKFAPT